MPSWTRSTWVAMVGALSGNAPVKGIIAGGLGLLISMVGIQMITGIERFGMFVALDETGAEGLLPLSALGEDSFRFDAQRHVLVGRHSDGTFALGDAIRVPLAVAAPVPASAGVTRAWRSASGG